MSKIPNEEKLNIGDKAPDFTATLDDNSQLTLSQLQGQNVVLYFYPRDNTPGCTREALEFTEWQAKFAACNTIILGVSKDSVTSHQRFKQKKNISYALIADTDSQVCNLYDVIKDKNMYGKLLKGIQRSTFLIDQHGNIKQIWRKVKVAGHVEAVYEALKA